MGLFRKSCTTNYTDSYVCNCKPQPAPNPSPDRWNILEKYEYKNGYVLKVHYLDCTNFEGIKVMVFEGKYKKRKQLDPHFSKEKDSPIARFRPNKQGLKMAQELAKSL